MAWADTCTTPRSTSWIGGAASRRFSTRTMPTVACRPRCEYSTPRRMLRRSEPKTLVCCALGLALILAAPSVRDWFELTMTRHMLLQLPLLALIGVCLAGASIGARQAGAAARALRTVQRYNAGGAT